MKLRFFVVLSALFTLFSNPNLFAQCTTLPTRAIDTFFCSGNGVIINGKTYITAGTYRDTIRRSLPLCDSVLNITIRTQAPTSETRNLTLCSGDTLKINGRTITQAGVYKDTIRATSTSCEVYVTLNVKAVDLRVSFGADVTIERGDSVKLTPSVSNTKDVVITWRPTSLVPCKSCIDPIVSPKITTTFELEVRDTVNGCIRSDDIIVNVKTCVGVFIPNAFSPNDDGKNDYFTVFTAPCVKQVKVLSVFNRWGGLMFTKENFEPNDEKLGWDGTKNGKAVPVGIYSFYVEVEQKDGSVQKYRGDIDVIR
ncbi:MAG: gliding motility-associated C-terminal domain-containing protein [Saprospiraceae bacterium]|nr:gliding motility-associated C-terminal domain-containing protein [Saprospiraceae bacterium]